MISEEGVGEKTRCQGMGETIADSRGGGQENAREKGGGGQEGKIGRRGCFHAKIESMIVENKQN